MNYIFKHEPDVIHRVPAVTGKNKNPTFNFKKVHRLEDINDYLIDYINTGSVSLPLNTKIKQSFCND